MPRVARIWKPISESAFAWGSTPGLSKSLTLMKTVPEVGMRKPAAVCDLAKAMPKSSEIPITSPVDFISGPSRMSVPGNFRNGKTDSLTKIREHRQVLGEALLPAGSSPP